MRVNNQYGFADDQSLNREWRPSAGSRAAHEAARDPGYHNEQEGPQGTATSYGRSTGMRGYGESGYGPGSDYSSSYGQGSYTARSGSDSGWREGNIGRMSDTASESYGYGTMNPDVDPDLYGQSSPVSNMGGSLGERSGGGDHRGKGPRNYKRSDERITEALCERLRDDEHLDASGIDVQVSAGEVVLSGTVDSRQAKRHAADLAETVSGVSHVENRIRVAPGGNSALSEQHAH